MKTTVSPRLAWAQAIVHLTEMRWLELQSPGSTPSVARPMATRASSSSCMARLLEIAEGSYTQFEYLSGTSDGSARFKLALAPGDGPEFPKLCALSFGQDSFVAFVFPSTFSHS